MNKVSFFSAAIGLLLSASTITQAASFISEPCNIGDVTVATFSADECTGSIAGNDNAGDLNTIFGEPSSSIIWEKAATYDIDSSTGTDLTASSGTSGTWEYTGADPLSSPFIMVLKASSEYSAYLFKSLADIKNGDTGTFLISFLNNGKQTPNLSHINIYSTNSNIPTTSIFGNPVPLPAALWLFGPALLGFMGFRRKIKS